MQLWWESIGAGEAVLLVPGRGDNADLFPRRFLDPVVGAGYRVLRYDPRDTGLSPDGGDTYGFADLAADALGVLDAAGEERAHVVGFSMGGLIVTDLLVQAPERLRSLAFVSASSPEPGAGAGPKFFDPPGDDAVLAILDAMHEPGDADCAWVEQEVEGSRRRAPARPDAVQRHQEAAFRSAWRDVAVLDGVRLPSLVVHGDADATLPVAHAHAFARIPRADLHVLPGMGHLPRPDQWDTIAGLVTDHLRSVADPPAP